MPIHRTLISTLLFIHIYKGIFFCPHWLILSLFSPQPGIRRALKTWTWIQCVCAFSASSSGRTAGKTISARWCRSPFMTRVRHNQTNTPKSLDRSQPSVPKIRQRTSLFSRFVMHVFLIPEATTTSQLKITHLNLYEGPCTGKTEVYMLCDKVQKGNRKVFWS